MEGSIKKAKANKKAMVASSLSDLGSLFNNELPADDCEYRMVTCGKVFPMSFIVYISNHTKIRHLYISTFNYGRKEIVFLNGLRQSGKLDRVTLMTAKMFAMSSKSGGLERLRQFTTQVFKQNEWTILYNDNHSKLVLLDTDDGCFVIETSCNFSESSCNEYFSIAKSQELFDFYQSWIESWNE